ncbi:Rrf2 family transcriptional regulator [bacterium]|nr:MAG: Rrf2 family transcriptional regulator [bacterium]
MIASKTCELAIRALILIAQDKSGEPVRISYLHEELEVGFSFMTKILQPLTHSGVLVSLKGAKGGLVLNKKPEEINLKQIVEIMDGDTLFTKCALGLPKCGHPETCAFHESWTPVRELLTQTFQQTTLAQLSKTGSESLLNKLVG